MDEGERAREDGGSAVGLGGGVNQSGARAYNDRLVLSLIRRHKALPKAELARLTGLSPQTLSVIVRRLEAEGLLRRGAPVRGRVGQPSVPYALDPDAAFSFGLKIGRRSAELVLCDFAGEVRDRARRAYAYPDPEAVMAFARAEAARLRGRLPPAARARLIGVGVAMPNELWSWSDRIPAPPGALEPWRGLDVAEAVAAVTGLPARIANDATAACAAELFGGDEIQHLDFIHVYVGWFIGGGVVLDGTLHAGRSGNAGALGSMPVQGEEGPTQLIARASLALLEDRLIAAGADRADPFASVGGAGFEPALEEWLDEAAPAIAQAVAGAAATIDAQAAYVDGAFPTDLRRRLVERTRAAFLALDRQGLSPLEILEGGAGVDARSVGAAILPFLAHFTRDQGVLLKTVPF